ncbi:MAG: methyltransferase domain-containing protein [Luteitalea sp.]|nr:methyltransferase domain-containing protein [Luteitalea sp.]
MERLLRATARAEAQHFWFRGFRYFVTPLLRQATAGVARPRLLDCGCGTGNNLELLSTFGRAYGFDLAAVGLELGRAAGRTRVARATVAAIPFPGNTFDVVTSFDVLYSLEEPIELAAIGEMYRVTRPGGHILINVAAMESLRGDHSALSREVRRYSRRSLARLVEHTGFSIVRITYTNAILFLPMAISRRIQRWRGLAAEEDAVREITVPSPPVNLVLAAALRLESLWVRLLDNPFGSSVLCLARKPASPGTRTASAPAFGDPPNATAFRPVRTTRCSRSRPRSHLCPAHQPG